MPARGSYVSDGHHRIRHNLLLQGEVPLLPGGQTDIGLGAERAVEDRVQFKVVWKCCGIRGTFRANSVERGHVDNGIDPVVRQQHVVETAVARSQGGLTGSENVPGQTDPWTKDASRILEVGSSHVDGRICVVVGDLGLKSVDLIGSGHSLEA